MPTKDDFRVPNLIEVETPQQEVSPNIRTKQQLETILKYITEMHAQMFPDHPDHQD